MPPHKSKRPERPFHSSRQEVDHFRKTKGLKAEPIDKRLAFYDPEFLLREELRPVRLQLELLKPELVLQDNHIDDTIVFFGSARIPEVAEAECKRNEIHDALQKDPDNPDLQSALRRADNVLKYSHFRDEATKLAYLVSQDDKLKSTVVTGGGPGFMEAANKGAYDANHRSVSLGVMLPHEQENNPYITPELAFQFHYFAIRKMHFLMRARALIAFPGGYGTLDELFEALTLIQTQKIDRIPLLLFCKKFWDATINFEALVDSGTISPEDIDLFDFVETAEEAWNKIKAFYHL